MSVTKVEQTHIAYSGPEELTNIISHTLGVAMSFVGLVFLMLKTTALGYSASCVAVVFICGLAITGVFAVSVLHHTMPYGTRRRAALRRLDRSSTFVLIFGVCAPIMLIGMMRGDAADGVWGIALFSVISVTTVLSIVFGAISLSEYKMFELIAYVVTGWACVIRIDRIAALCGSECFWLFIGGCAAYVLGIILYAIKKIPFNHAIRHFCVMVGAALHFVCIYTFLL